MIAIVLGGKPHADNIGACSRLAHGQCAHVLAADEGGQITRLLIRGAVAVDLVDAEVGVGAVGEADRGAGATHLLHHQHVGQITEAHAVILFRHSNAVQPEFAHLGPEIPRKDVAVIDLAGARRYHFLAEGLDLLGQGAEGLIHHCVHPCSPLNGWFSPI